MKQHDRSGAWPTRWSSATSPSRARFRARAGRSAKAPSRRDLRSDRRRHAGHPPRLHRAAHDPAEHLPAAAEPRRQLDHAVIEYGNAIKDLVRQHLPGDMLWKNFGVTRNGTVVFYDYDEIEYLTDCHFRACPRRRPGRCRARSGTGRPARRLPGDLRPLPARRRAACAGVHAPPRRPARCRLLAGHNAHPGRPRATYPPATGTSASCRHRQNAARKRASEGLNEMEVKDAFWLAASWSPWWLPTFRPVGVPRRQRRAARNEEEETYQHLSGHHGDFL